jgi:hypothetical protein
MSKLATAKPATAPSDAPKDAKAPVDDLRAGFIVAGTPAAAKELAESYPELVKPCTVDGMRALLDSLAKRKGKGTVFVLRGSKAVPLFEV